MSPTARNKGPVRGRAGAAAAMLTALIAGAPPSALAQAPTGRVAEGRQEVAKGAAPAPALGPAATRRIEAAFLTDDERSALRVYHGVWMEGDLDTPERAAAAALTVGAWDDPSLLLPEVSAMLRARGALGRGEAERALEIVEGGRSVGACRLRAEALAALGRFDEAIVAAREGIDVVIESGAALSADGAVDGVRLLALQRVLRSPRQVAEGGGEDLESMMRVLGEVRSRRDPFSVEALLAEAELLYAHDNAEKAAQAAAEALGMNPSSAAATYLLGRLAVDSYSLDRAEAIASRLDELAARMGAVSAGAGTIRARARLRQQDGQGAETALAPVLAAYPEHREALALWAAAAAVTYDDGALRERMARFEELSPGSPAAMFEVGKALSEARQYEAAAGMLGAAHERLPSWPAPVAELGLLLMQAGRDDEALGALEQARRLDPFNVRVDNTLRLVRELTNYAEIEGEHFVVRYKPGIDEVLAREMLAPLGRNHDIVTGSGPGGIDHEPADKTVIELMPDHAWFAVRIAGMPQLHTIAAATGPVIAMEAPREGAGHMGVYDWVRVVRHEYTHTVTLSRTLNRIPHWFTEASAVYLEQSPRDYQACGLLWQALENDALFDMDEINVMFVRPRRPSDRSQAYAQGHWMYEFIVERWGTRAPLELMDLYAQGVKEEAAFAAVLGVSRRDFFGDFVEWARMQARLWGMTPPPGAPSLRELAVRAAVEDETSGAAIREQLARLARAASLAGAGAGAPDVGDGPEIEPPSITRAQVETWLVEFPDHPDLLEFLVQEAGGATDENVALLERYARARPVDPLPHRLLARYYLDGGGEGPSGAIEHLEYLDAREVKSAAYAAELTRRYAAAGDWDAAWAKAKRATWIAPYDADLRELAAAVAVKRGDLDAAEREITALTMLEPDRAAHRERLDALRRLKERQRPQ